MGQITNETIAMIRRAIDAGQAPPLTLWEYTQLAFLAEKQIATQPPAIPAAPAAVQASGERPSGPGLYAWVPEHGSPSIVLVGKRPSAHCDGGTLNGQVIESSKFYDGCAMTSWPATGWVNLEPALASPPASVGPTQESTTMASDFISMADARDEARKLKDETGQPMGHCCEAVAQNHGYKNWASMKADIESYYTHCPWCGKKGPDYDECDPPATYCSHDD